MSGKAKKSPVHGPEVKAAVIAALLAGQSVSQVARQYKLPKGTVSNWKNRKAEGVRESGETVPSSGTQKRESIGDLLVELVRENLKGLLAGARLLQDVEWLKQQDAAELGTLFGITHDKTVRMLEAMDAQVVEPPAMPAA